MKKILMMGALMPLLGLSLAAPALAHPPAHAPAWGYYKKDRAQRDSDRYVRYDRYDRYDRYGRYDPYDRYDRYNRNGYTARYERDPRYGRSYERDYWVDRSGRYYNDYRACRDSNAEGTVVGVVAGGALGNVIAPQGSKTLGTVIGAGIGGVIGHEIDKNDRVRRC